MAGTEYRAEAALVPKRYDDLVKPYRVRRFDESGTAALSGGDPGAGRPVAIQLNHPTPGTWSTVLRAGAR